jgi:hypothetical protein
MEIVGGSYKDAGLFIKKRRTESRPAVWWIRDALTR